VDDGLKEMPQAHPRLNVQEILHNAVEFRLHVQ
jgi:hypothetical protein